MNSETQNQKIKEFQKIIWEHYRKNKRSMPWRETTDPYRILVSEIMLQQTQVSRVIPKYLAFLERFPSVSLLASAPLADLLGLWQGLGYNRRAINLQKAAKEIVEKWGAEVPCSLEALDDLSGIGPATAEAIRAYAWNEPVVYIETNIRRCFIHFFFPQSEKVPDAELLPLVEAALDRKNPREWYYALMDYGAFLKTEVPNPNKRSKHYVKQSKFSGSNREIRGKILKILLEKKKMSERELCDAINPKDPRVLKNIETMISEGFLQKKQMKEGSIVSLS